MKAFNILIALLLAGNAAFSQNSTKEKFQKQDAKIDSLRKIDFLSYKYKYLGENFKIKIPNEIYKKTVEEYKFFPERIKTYRDSLSVVLMTEFKDWDAARISELRICYEWKRVGYHTWISELEILNLAKKLNVKMPYRLQEMFLNNDPKVKSEIQNLRNKLYAKSGNEEIKKMPTDKLLLYSFKNNPEVVELRKKVHKQNLSNQNK